MASLAVHRCRRRPSLSDSGHRASRLFSAGASWYDESFQPGIILGTAHCRSVNKPRTRSARVSSNSGTVGIPCGRASCITSAPSRICIPSLTRCMPRDDVFVNAAVMRTMQPSCDMLKSYSGIRSLEAEVACKALGCKECEHELRVTTYARLTRYGLPFGSLSCLSTLQEYPAGSSLRLAVFARPELERVHMSHAGKMRPTRLPRASRFRR